MTISALEERPGSFRQSPAFWVGCYLALVSVLMLATPEAAWLTGYAGLADLLPKTVAAWVALAVFRSAGHAPRVRQCWGLVALALAILVSVEVARRVAAAAGASAAVQQLIGSAFFLMHPLLLLALLRLQRVFRSREAALAFALDALVVVLGAAMVLWVLVLEPAAAQAGLAPGFIPMLRVLAYPVGDLLLLYALTTLVLRRPADAPRRIYLWAGAGLACALLGDLLWTRMVFAGEDPRVLLLVHWIWLITPWFFLIAAQRQLRSRSLPGRSEPDAVAAPSILPYAATLLAASLMLTEGLLKRPGGTPIVMVLAALLFLAVLARQALMQRRALRLAREQAERESETRRDALLEHSADAILILDGARRIQYANPGFERMLGRRVPAAGCFPDLIEEHERPRVEAMLRRTDSSSATHRTRLRLAAAGGTVTAEAAISNFGAESADRGAIINLRDVTEQVALEEQLAQRVLRDPLTGLPNRALFLDRLGQALVRAGSGERRVAVLLADLDRFKVVNDTLGHGAGDTVLREAAERLVEAAPAGTTVARAADDEFAVIIEGELSVDDVTKIAEVIHAAFDAPFDVDDRPVVVTASIGIAGPGRADSAAELLRKADVAMNQAKSAGRNQVMAFEARIDRAIGSRAAMLSGLRDAVASRRIDVAFQPIYDIVGNRLYGLEALARWVHPEQGRVAPGVFIAVAEDGGLMLELGALIFDRALESAQAIERDFVLSVNISVQQLADHGFSGLILNGLRAAGWPPERLLLEMTESVLAEDRRVVRRNLRYLRDAGVRIAIDDFGTGYSSLSQLHDVPVDVLKIDRRFIDQLDTEAGAETVRAVIAIGRALGLDIIAEGVENEEQLVALRGMGCRYIQGFLFGQPLFADDLKRLSTRPG